MTNLVWEAVTQSTPNTLQVRKLIHEYRTITASKALGPRSEAVRVPWRAQTSCLLLITPTQARRHAELAFAVCKALSRSLATVASLVILRPEERRCWNFSFLSIISTCPQPHEFMKREGRGPKMTPSCHAPSRVYQARVDSSGCKTGHPTPHLRNMQWLPVPI